MKLLCSGGLYDEPIEDNECLSCAIEHAGTQPCGYSYQLIRALLSSDESEKRASEVHVTDLVSCLKKAYLNKTDPRPMYLHDKLILWLGVAVHDALDIDDGTVKAEVPLKRDEVVGRADAIFPYEKILLDTKTTRWINLNNLPYGDHEAQVNAYNWMLNDDHELQIQYIDFAGPTKCRQCKVSMVMEDGEVLCPLCGYVNKNGHLGAVIYHVPVDGDFGEWFEGRKDALIDALAFNQEPDPEPSFMCRYCSHDQCEENPFNPTNRR